MSSMKIFFLPLLILLILLLPGAAMAAPQDWSTRAELTDVLGELRRLEQQARTSALGREAADRMRALRSRASQLHSAMASGGAALRVLRATVVENAGGSSGDAAR